MPYCVEDSEDGESEKVTGRVRNENGNGNDNENENENENDNMDEERKSDDYNEADLKDEEGEDERVEQGSKPPVSDNETGTYVGVPTWQLHPV